MLSIDRILFPTDRGEGAAPALAHAALLAEKHGAVLEVFHVVGVAGAPHRTLDLAQIASRARIEEVERAGDSALRTILAHAEETDADVLVMATHGRRGIDRLLIGSIAEHVVRAAPCAVLVVGPRAEAPPAAGARILVPIDFSAHSEGALRHAVGLAEGYDATVDLVHAVHVPTLPPGYGVVPLGADRTPAFVEGSRSALAGLAERHVPPARRGDIVVEVGHPADVILSTIDARHPTLVVLATHGQTALQRLAMGSIAEYVVRRAHCAVFTVRSFGKSLLPGADAPGD